MEIGQDSIKKNFLYNLFFRMINILIPLITFSYATRILYAENIGKVDFSLSVIQYFILFSQLGIPIYAIRECSKYRDDKEKLSKTVQEILFINIVMIIISYIAFVLIVFNANKLHNYNNLLIVMSISIFTSSIGMDWFYQSIEQYKLLAKRALIVKILALCLVLLFVKNESDYLLYGFIIIISDAVGYIYNFLHANKYINLFKIYPNYEFKKHILPLLTMFMMNLSISIYVNLSQVMLGLISGDRAVGLYTVANRMVRAATAGITALGTVLLPRMTYYIHKGKTDEINNLIKKSIDFILMISIPMTIGFIMLANPIIVLYSGYDFLEAVNTLKIVSPIIVAIGLSNLIGMQILVSHGKEKLTIISTLAGAIINFISNLILIPLFNQNGAAIGTLLAEVVVTLTQLFLAFKYIKGKINLKSLFMYLISGIMIILTCNIVSIINTNIIMKIFLSVCSSVSIYFICLLVMKNELLIEYVILIKKKLIRIKE